MSRRVDQQLREVAQLPRYFFHNYNSESQIDEVGIELPDDAAAKKRPSGPLAKCSTISAKPFGPFLGTKCALWMRTAARYVDLPSEGEVSERAAAPRDFRLPVTTISFWNQCPKFSYLPVRKTDGLIPL